MNIIAIGGGDKTPAIRHALDHLSVDKAPVLLVPTACSTPASYERKIPAAKAFFEELGVEAQVLHEYGEKPSLTKVQHEIGNAGLIYTIGGNSPYMLEKLREHGSDVELRSAIMNGKMHAGTSAGALLPFEQLHSNIAKKPTEEEWDFKILNGLGVIRAVATAHADQHDPTPRGVREDSRLEHLTTHMPAGATLGFGIENGAALVIDDVEARVLRAKETANVHVIRPHDGKHRIETLARMPIEELQRN